MISGGYRWRSYRLVCLFIQGLSPGGSYFVSTLDQGDHIRLATREGTHRRLADVVAHAPEELCPQVVGSRPDDRGLLEHERHGDDKRADVAVATR